MKKSSLFFLPKKIADVGSKIKNLFYRDQSQTTQQTIKARAISAKRKTGKTFADHNHYADFEYQKELQNEVGQLQKMLDADFKNQRIVDLENKIRDNKRIIVNTMTENIFNLRHGFAGNKQAVKKLDRDELLLRMLQSRLKRIRIVENLIKLSNDRKTELMTWGMHSDLIDYRRTVRVTQDIVILLQEKNLLFELQGKQNFVKVGEIERQMDWPIRIRSQFGPMDAKDYYSSKLRAEIDQHNSLLIMIDEDCKTNTVIMKEMKAFISAIFGNDGWIRLTEARWLRLKQNGREAEYDPREHEAVQVYVKTQHYNPMVPRQIIDELPTHGTDQFGGYHARSYAEPQIVSKALFNKLTTHDVRK